LSVCSAKWSPLRLMDVALDTIIVRIVIYRRESEKRSTVDATVSEKRGASRQATPARRPQLQQGRLQETLPIPLRK
jgi:hypothetical protein